MPPPRPSSRRWSARTRCAGSAESSCRSSIDLDAPPADASDAYLRLHLLSHRVAEPNTINLDGIFGALTNVVWTSRGRARWTASR